MRFFKKTHSFLEARHLMVKLFHYICCRQNTLNTLLNEGTCKKILSYQYLSCIYRLPFWSNETLVYQFQLHQISEAFSSSHIHTKKKKSKYPITCHTSNLSHIFHLNQIALYCSSLSFSPSSSTSSLEGLSTLSLMNLVATSTATLFNLSYSFIFFST